MSDESKNNNAERFWTWTTRVFIGITSVLLMNILSRFESFATSVSAELQLLRTDIEVIKNTGAKSVDVEVLKIRVGNIEKEISK